VYLWRRRASRTWLDGNEGTLCTIAGDTLAIIERPDRKQVQCEVASNHRGQLENIARQFGGRIRKLPRDWLKRALDRKSRPIKIRNRKLWIPAGAAFGTGEHVTTAMCLRMLKQAMEFWGAYPPRVPLLAPRRKVVGRKIRANAIARTRGRVHSPALVVDLGTGSGILALAAKLLGAKNVIGIDNDPIAISTAKRNARLNRIRGVKFRVADVKRWKMPHDTDVVTANLFSGLLVEVIPQLSGARCLILSGILRAQERDVRRALTQSNIDIVDVRRHGKWVAMLAGRR